MQDITPEHLKCILGSCPSVSYDPESGNVMVVGRRPTFEEAEGTSPSTDEVTAVIHRDYFIALGNAVEAWKLKDE
jgi:hypothetical protein